MFNSGFWREANFCCDFVRRNEYRHTFAQFMSFKSTIQDFASQFFCFSQVGVMMVVTDVFCTWQTSCIRCSDNLCVETTCYVHNSRVYVLNVSYPAIKSTCTKYKLSTDSITQWNNIFITVHARQTRAADTVELDTFSTDSFCFF